MAARAGRGATPPARGREPASPRRGPNRSPRLIPHHASISRPPYRVASSSSPPFLLLRDGHPFTTYAVVFAVRLPPMLMASGRPPLDALTADNTGAAVIVVAYTLALLSVVISTIHFWNAVVRKTKFGFDDASYVLANVRVCPTAI